MVSPSINLLNSFSIERPRSPGPIYDVAKSSQAVLPHHPISSLDCSGRALLGSIYWDQFNLKSAGNYYHGQEAYLNHTTAPAALPSPSPIFPPKQDSQRTRSMRDQVDKNLNPITSLVESRSGSSQGQGKEKERTAYFHRSHHRGKKGLL